MYTTLIEAPDLSAHSRDADWVVLDCRFELGRPESGASAYAQGHIPSAIYAHLDRNLSGPVTSTSGRHPLPLVEAFAATLGRWGIDESTQVVAYDQGNGAYASRLWWLLRWLGHSRVAVLNGGFAAWQHAGLVVSKKPSVRQPRRFAAKLSQNSVVSTVELERLLAT